MNLARLFRRGPSRSETFALLKRTYDAADEVRSHVLSVLKRTYDLGDQTNSVREETLLLMGQTAALALPKQVGELSEAQFRVFSQFGEDGIIQFLLRTIRPPRSFVEFGVQTYRESNTRFLLMHNGWRGVVFEQDQGYIDRIRAEPWYGWKYPLSAQRAQVTAENINALFRDAGLIGDIGLMSIDVDGIDYYLWEALEVAKPAIVVIEYNRGLPVSRPITVPYDPAFDRDAQPRGYHGASIAALAHLANRKGYRFVGVESHRTNAFFVGNEVADGLPEVTPSPEHAVTNDLSAIASLPVLNVATGTIERLVP
jgi:hypothetical protein